MEIQIGAETLFWLSFAALGYTFAGYPVLLLLAGWLRPRGVRRESFTPLVSVIITAYNEERDLAAKLENTLALDYPRDRLEIIVASDCSTDGTDAIVRAFSQRGVCLWRQKERLGKTAAQNAAVNMARGEVLLFSDATGLCGRNTLRAMVANFADPEVGCVSGQLVYVNPSLSNVGHGIRSYWSYEKILKRLESRCGSMIGASGCLYAVRRSAYVPLDHSACSDFLIASMVVQQGLRAVYEPEAICTEVANRRPGKELQMRVRIIVRTLGDLWRHRRMMNPLRHGLFAVQLFSHKVLRYTVPLFLVGSALASSLLAGTSLLYTWVLVAQAGVCGAAVVGWILDRAGVHSTLFALPQYFLLGNLASVIAICKFLRGETFDRWEPIRESVAASHVGRT